MTPSDALAEIEETILTLEQMIAESPLPAMRQKCVEAYQRAIIMRERCLLLIYHESQQAAIIGRMSEDTRVIRALLGEAYTRYDGLLDAMKGWGK